MDAQAGIPISKLCQLTGLGRHGTPALSVPSGQVTVLQYPSPTQGARLLGEVVNSSVVVGNTQDEPEHRVGQGGRKPLLEAPDTKEGQESQTGGTMSTRRP